MVVVVVVVVAAAAAVVEVVVVCLFQLAKFCIFAAKFEIFFFLQKIAGTDKHQIREKGDSMKIE